MKIEHSKELLLSYVKPLPDSFKTEVNWKLCFQTRAEDSFRTQTNQDWNLCACKITQSIWHPCNHSENSDKSLRLQTSMCKFPAVTSSSFKSVLPLHWEYLDSSVQLDVLLFMCPWALSRPLRQYPVHTGSPGVLQCRSSSPSVCLHMSWSLQSLLSWGYLIRPSLLTGPSSDLGSGDRELQEVLEQGPTAGQDEVCVAHKSPVTQKVPMLLSTHASRGWPTSWALRWASCMAESWGGSCSTELSCWKLCSRYRLPGGPAWSQLSSSAMDI